MSAKIAKSASSAGRVKLRAATARDFDVLSKLRNDFDVQVSLLAVARPNSPRRVRAWLERRAAADDGAFFVIADVRDDRAVGFIQAGGIDPLHRVAEVGICLEEEARGRGLGREAMMLLERYLASVFRIRKIWLRVDAANLRVVALYRSAGFRRAGMLEKHHYARGRYRDVLLMEKLLDKGATKGR